MRRASGFGSRRVVKPRAQSPATPQENQPAPPEYGLNYKVVWSSFKRQPVSFWLICLYLVFEYVRPQQIYQPLVGLGLPFFTIIGCGLALLNEGRRFRPWNVADTTLAIFSGVVLVSSVTAYRPSVAFGALSLFLSWVIVYVLITWAVDTERRFFLFLGVYLLACAKMTQHSMRSWAEGGFAFRSWGVSCAPAWFHNSGECGVQMSMTFPVALFFLIALWIYWQKWVRWAYAALLPAGSVITAVATSSRGALVALAGVALWMVARSKHRIRALVLLATMTPVVIALIPPEQMERFRSMGEDGTSVNRQIYWEHGLAIMNQHPLFGVGYSNWLPYYGAHYGWAELPHNIFLEAGAELGYPGLAAFLAMIAATFVLNARTRKSARLLPVPQQRLLGNVALGLDGALVGYLISGFFVTVLYYPFFWINLAMTSALHSATLQEMRKRTAGAPGRRAQTAAPMRSASAHVA